MRVRLKYLNISPRVLEGYSSLSEINAFGVKEIWDYNNQKVSSGDCGMNKVDLITISEQTSIIDTIKVIDKGEIGIALVVNGDKCLRGTVTDGDIRRALIKGASLQSEIAPFMTPHPIKAHINSTEQQLKSIMQAKSVEQIPLVDENDRLVGIKTLPEIVIGLSKKNAIVIMAGGLGTRLRPLTHTTPKPLLPIGNKPILETIIEHSKDFGLTQIYISLNYMSQSIKKYFGNGEGFGVNIEYIEEKEELGTAGALSLLKEAITEDVFVINGDILTRVNFDKFLVGHQQSQSMMTVGIRPYKTQIPYGIIETKDEYVEKIEEKPLLEYQINAGIYLLRPEAVQIIPKNTVFHMTHLMETLLSSNHKVGSYLIDDYWLDIGKINDYYRANLEFNDFFM